ncbi:hypothetical protein Lalb_Chr12g0199341 [Lupinus albus]|uniref:DUF761 domain-containing protein n=1 Tax=Lupinus albus TaxID=3870 RepID=A0A6A4PLV3_LUPAL|nr:hypothetical protein Lalb_Chr12g0199341 [Lupinus albus]
MNTHKQNKSIISRLKAAVNKVRFILSSTVLSRMLHVASVIRSGSMSKRNLSFNDRPGLVLCSSEKETSSGSSSRELHRTISFPSDDDDIDRRAEAFIANFRNQLRMERQISLQLRYCRQPSFEFNSP